MGSGSSAMVERTKKASLLGLGLGDLPEDCLALVLTSLRPNQICSLAMVNRTFTRAAAADFVWEKKLPENYRYLLEVAGYGGGEGFGKKEIYARLCRPNPFHGGLKVFWLERSRGGICLAMSARSLAITGVDDRRYWSCIPSEESRFNSVAYLQQTWWFEVNGDIDFHFPTGMYSMFIRLQLGRPSKRFGLQTCDYKHVHGWDKKPVRFQLSTSNGQHSLTERYLGDPKGWTNYHVGDFVMNDSNTLTKVKFSVTQIDCTHTKGGLSIDSVSIFPKKF